MKFDPNAEPNKPTGDTKFELQFTRSNSFEVKQQKNESLKDVKSAGKVGIESFGP